MTSKLTIDLTDPNVADAFRDCQVGREETLASLTFVPTSKTDTTLQADVLSAEPGEDYGEAEDETESGAAEPAGGLRAKRRSNLPQTLVMIGLKGGRPKA